MQEFKADFPFRLIPTMLATDLVHPSLDTTRDFEIIFIEREDLSVEDCPVEP
jgi:hypothetical protein